MVKKFDRRGSGPWFFVAIALIFFLAYCGAVAALTAEDCGGSQSWQWLPPKWNCEKQLPGYG